MSALLQAQVSTVTTHFLCSQFGSHHSCAEAVMATSKRAVPSNIHATRNCVAEYSSQCTYEGATNTASTQQALPLSALTLSCLLS